MGKQSFDRLSRHQNSVPKRFHSSKKSLHLQIQNLNTSPEVSVRKFLGQSSQLRKMNKIIFCLMGLPGMAMAGYLPGRVDMIPKPSELPLPSTPCFDVGMNDFTDGQKFKTTTAMDCWSMCKLEKSCMGFAWAKPTAEIADTQKNGCWLKKAAPGKAFPQTRTNKDHAISGLRDCLY